MTGLKIKMRWYVVVFLIAGSWLGNLWYFQSMQLKEALFLKHDSTINGSTGEILDFTFFENKQASNKVSSIQIEELPEFRFQIYKSNIHTHQSEMRASGQLIPDLINEERKIPFTIREIKVYYEKGQSRKVPIGEINVLWNKRESILDFASGSSSSNGSGSYKVYVRKAAVLEKIEYTFSDKVKPWFKLDLSGKPLALVEFPMKLSQDDSLAFTYQWSIPDNELEAYTMFKSKIILHFKLDDGQEMIENIPINHNLNFSERQLKRLVRSGGEMH
ncbi:hypothetical protein [Paenibacillus sp. NRS-1760]|uniref:hypothetical protein n=1 Tax=Paenibacillus sp. NRS-1760 TaxID=3233902 RepID=UPI003D2D1373